jgi:hypothetical protein
MWWNPGWATNSTGIVRERLHILTDVFIRRISLMNASPIPEDPPVMITVVTVERALPIRFITHLAQPIRRLQWRFIA